MISVILYGRNDSHGYNLHKRAAISLNCIAEVLTDADDEILFVDCNTSNELPTFIEAIYDTLTSRARALLRVFRLRPELYSRLVGETHLFATEPHTRNIALRRSNPRNHWVLSTNTDMIFLPENSSPSLSDVVRDLPDGHYVVPRYELPEPLWESFQRSDPSGIMRLCEQLAPRLHLHEVARRVPYMRFDSPGDFQLVPRQVLFDICGFDERMTHGWHVDSNMCKRLYLFFDGRTESLANRVQAYHCDHTRVATLAHRADLKLDNSLQEFVWDLTDPVAHHQAETWGAPLEPIEELDFAIDPSARYLCAAESALGDPQQAPYFTDCNDARNFVYYPPERALSYLAANLTVYPRGARFLYAGNNPRMLGMIDRCIREMGFTESLSYVSDLLTTRTAPACAVGTAANRVANFSAIIFDFGLDPTGLELGTVLRVTDWPRDLRYSLGAVARFMEVCAGQANTAPDFLVLNANHYIFKSFVEQLLLSTETPYPIHVRKGRPRKGQDLDYRGASWKYNADQLCSYFAYDELDHSLVSVAPGHAIDLTSEGHSARYKDGHWGSMDYTGTWTDGRVATVLFRPPDSLNDDLIAQVRLNEAFLGPDEAAIRVKVFFEGEYLIQWTVYTRFSVIVCKALLPARLMAGKQSCRLEFHIENPQSPQALAEARGDRIVNEDPRELGIKVQNIRFCAKNSLKYSVGDTLDFTENGQGAAHCNECWTQPDNYGQWTLGPEPNLVLLLNEPVREPLWAIFTITDAAVDPRNANVDVQVDFGEHTVAKWTLGPARLTHERRILLPDGLSTSGPVLISFHIRSPRTPKELNWSSWDTRPLGFRLTKLLLIPAGPLKYRLGDLIDLTDRGNSAAFVGDLLGVTWSQPERFGSWTIGEEASLTIRFEAAPSGSVAASFVVSDWMTSKTSPPFGVRVIANGHPVGQWDLDSSRGVHLRSLNLPAEAVAGQRELVLTFQIATPRSPELLGWGADPRPLGLRLARLSIGRSDVPMPAFGKRLYIVRRLFERILGLPNFVLHHLRLLAKWWYER